MTQSPSLGRIVTYMIRFDRDSIKPRAAIITAVDMSNNNVNLTVFLGGDGAGETIQSVRNIAYSPDREPGTWCWPDRS